MPGRSVLIRSFERILLYENDHTLRQNNKVILRKRYRRFSRFLWR